MTGWAWEAWLADGETLIRSAEGHVLSLRMGVVLALMGAWALVLDRLPRMGGGETGDVGFFTGGVIVFALALGLAEALWRWRYAITGWRVLVLSGPRLGKPRLSALPLQGARGRRGARGEVFVHAPGGASLTMRFLPAREAAAFAQAVNASGPEAVGPVEGKQ